MARPLKRYIFGGLAAVALVAAALSAAAKSPTVVSGVLRFSLTRAFGKAAAPRIEIASVTHAFPSDWTLRDVRAALLLPGGALTLRADELRVTDLFALLRGRHEAGLTARGVVVNSSPLSVSDAEVWLRLARTGRNVHWRGRVRAGRLSWRRTPDAVLALTVFRAGVEGDSRGVVFHEMTAGLCGGMLGGDIRAGFAAPLAYTARVEFNGVEAGTLAAALGRTLGGVDGRMSGRLRVEGRGVLLDALDVAASLPSGGTVGQVLVAMVFDHVPVGRQKVRLGDMLRKDAPLAVEDFSFSLAVDSPERFSGTMLIRSRDPNVDMHLTHELRADARLDTLWTMWGALSGAGGAAAPATPAAPVQ